MMKKLLLLLTFPLILSLSSCELLNEEGGLTPEKIVQGLKEALTIGADSASSSLSITNGYYLGDAVHIKIPLPEEAENVRLLINEYSSITSYFNLDAEFENVVKAINRAAEKAASDALPIFADAVTDMSIENGLDILNGKVPGSAGGTTDFDSTAATEYLKIKTYTDLTNLYAPHISEALDQDLGLGFSANDAWKTLTKAYNDALNSSVVQGVIFASQFTSKPIVLPNAIETDLGVFSTQKALDGLFYMVGKEEKKIRKDPFQYLSDLLCEVFGSVM
jgi:hypothetical protein